MDWFNNLSPHAQAAVIGAIVTLIGIFLRDLLFTLWKDKKERKKASVSIYQKYAEPLASAATSLLWRLHEIFYGHGRGDYLKNTYPETKFDKYKKLSTLFRLGNLIGWIRAYKREIFFFQLDNKTRLNDLDNAISSFEASLADGPHVEQQRLHEICLLWDIKLPKNEKELIELGIKIEQCLKRKLSATEFDLAMKLPDEEKLKLCNDVAEMLCNQVGCKKLSNEIVKETKARAIQAMSTREFWIYRDWQAGIGDLLIGDITDSPRKYEVIGFRQFEKMCVEGTEEQKRWLLRLNSVFDDLDVTIQDKYDMRINQLRNTLFSVAKILIAISEIESTKSIVTEATKKVAVKVLKDENSKK